MSSKIGIGQKKKHFPTNESMKLLTKKLAFIYVKHFWVSNNLYVYIDRQFW